MGELMLTKVISFYSKPVSQTGANPMARVFLITNAEVKFDRKLPVFQLFCAD